MTIPTRNVMANHTVTVFECALPLASIIHAPCRGTIVCRAHYRLDAKCTCDGNYVCAQILGAYIITMSPGHLANS